MSRSLLLALAAGVTLAAEAPAPAPASAQRTDRPSVEVARVGVGVVEKRVSLAEMVERALKNNVDLDIERTNITTASYALQAARGAFDPVLRYSPNFQNATTPTASALAAANGAAIDKSFNNNLGFVQRIARYGTQFNAGFDTNRLQTNNPFVNLNPYYTSRFSATFTQPLLRNFRNDPARAEIRIRSKQIGVAETDLSLRTIDVVSRVEQAYWDLVAARADVAVQEDFVQLGRQQLALNQRLISAGTLAPVELAASEAELQRRLDTYYTGLGIVTQAENALKQLVTNSPQDELWNDALVPTDVRTTNLPAADELRPLVDAALRKRPEFKSIAQRREITTVQKELAEDQRKPQVDLVAGYISQGLAGAAITGPNPFTASNAALYGRLNELSTRNGLQPITVPQGAPIPQQFVGGIGSAYGNLFGGNYNTWQAGVNIDFNLRNRTAEANIGTAVTAERRLELERTRAAQTIEAQVRNALQGIVTARQRVAAAEASVKAAQQKLESETRLFETGESTNFLVLTRQNELADSRRREVLAKLELNRSSSRLNLAVGQTLETYQIQVK